MSLNAIAKWSLAAAVFFTVMVALCAVAFADYANDNKYTEDGALVVDASGTTVTVSGTLSVTPTLSGSTTIGSVNDTNVSTTLITANTGRKQLTIVNDSTAILYVLLGSGTASATNYTYRLDQYYTAIVDAYSGQVNGVWASDASGAARITEVY